MTDRAERTAQLGAVAQRHPDELTRATAAGLILRQARLEVTAAAIRELSANVSAAVARKVADDAATTQGWTGGGLAYHGIRGLFPHVFGG